MTNIAKRSTGLISVVITLIGLVTTTIFPAFPFQARAASRDNTDVRNHASQNRLGEAHGRKPLSFESNQGQADSNVKFISRAEGFTLFLTADGALMKLGKPEEPSLGLNRKPSGSFLRMTLAGGNSSAPIEGIDQIASRSNYIIGNDPANWRTNVANYAKVRQQSVYPGVDLIYHGNEQHLEYDFIVNAGADYTRIALELEGAKQITIDANGDLVISTSGGEVRQRKPFIYQEEKGVRKEIAGRYQIKGKHRVGFYVPAYDRSRPLVIDPEIVYSTYFGGSKTASGGSDKGDNVVAMAVDAAGNTYVAGNTNSIDFPVTPNAFQSEHGSPGEAGGRAVDAFVSKFDPTGGLVYSTYLGGKTMDEAYGIAADSAGNIYVTGESSSPNFPTTSGAFRTKCVCDADGHPDGFVVKLNSTGSLVYSTFLGVETYGLGDIAVDAAGNAYVLGDCGLGLPIVNGLQLGAQRGAFLVKLNSTGSALLYSTYLSSDLSYARGLAIDSAGNAYLTGETYSLNFPVKNAAWSTKRGGEFGPSPDMFVAKIDTTKSGADSLIYSTYLPASGGFDIALGVSGCVYVSGDASPKDFPRKTILKELKWNEEDDKLRFPYDLLVLGFVAKLDPAKSGDSSLVYCTFYSRSAFNGRSIGLDAEENVYLAGSSSSPEQWPLPIVNASFGGGVFIRSSDDGQTFETLDHGLPNVQLTHLAIDPKSPSYIYGGHNGLFKSTDGGFNWVSIDKDIRVPVHHANVLAIDPQTPSTLYAGVDASGIDPDEQVLADVFKSSDRGESWKATGLVYRGVNVRALAIDPGNTAVIYAGGTSGWAPGSLGQKVAGVFKSMNGGDTWNVMNNGLTNIDVNVLAIDPIKTSTVYAGTKSGLFKSTDGGNFWNATGPTDQVIAMAIDAKAPSTVYASLVDPSFNLTSVDGRGNPRRRIHSDAVTPGALDPKLEGLIKSTNGGETWRDSNTGFENFLPVAYDIKISSQDSSMLYLGTDAGMYTSNNAGQSWSFNSRMSNPVRALAVHPRAKSVFYAATVTNDKAYLTKLSADGTKLMYASYLGGNTNDSAFCVALDRAGNLYVAGTTTSWNFPTTNAFQSELKGYLSSFITKISGLDNLPEPKEPLPIRDVPLRPKISAVSVSGKKLVVQGDDFSMGAAIILNGVEQQTSNDAETPAARLMSKKAGKRMKIGQEAMIQVRNSDGSLSETFRFVRQE